MAPVSIHLDSWRSLSRVGSWSGRALRSHPTNSGMSGHSCTSWRMASTSASVLPKRSPSMSTAHP
eukprot:6899278-Alexandrium_andersonii.AAC.1